MASLSNFTIFKNATALLSLELLEDVPNLEHIITHLKQTHGLTLTETKDGYNVIGTLSGLSVLEQKIKEAIRILPKSINIWCTKAKAEPVEKFLSDRKKWGFQIKYAKDRVSSRSNVYVDTAQFSYLMIDKREELYEVLIEHKASIYFKDFKDATLRICIETIDSSSAVVDGIIRQLCTASTLRMQSIYVETQNLKYNQDVVSEIVKDIRPYLVFIKANTTPANTSFITVLVMSTKRDKSEATLRKIIENNSYKSEDVSVILHRLCDKQLSTPKPTITESPKMKSHSHLPSSAKSDATGVAEGKYTGVADSVPKKDGAIITLENGYKSHSNKIGTGSKSSTIDNAIASNGHNIKPDKDTSPQLNKSVTIQGSNKNPGKIQKTVEQREVTVADEDVIDYMMRFRGDELKQIERKYHAKVDFTKRDEGILIIHAEPENIEKADLTLSRLVQAIYFDERIEAIDLIKVTKEMYDAKYREALDIADSFKFYVNTSDKHKWHIIGPGADQQECVRRILGCFGISSSRSRRRLVTTSSTDPLNSSHFGNDSLSNSMSLPPLTNEPRPQAYCIIDGQVQTFTWVTDITKLKVDVVVNAANEHLAHGAGVALGIAKAAGPTLEDESRRYITNYGPLRIGNNCLTTAGNMPAKLVMHAVGPRWNDYTDKPECVRVLYNTFYNCLDRANANGYLSIAIPAISSGLFGIPKDIVAQNAVLAIIYFCKQQPFAKLKYIHLVDIQHDIISLYQKELTKLVSSGIFSVATNYADYGNWISEAPNAMSIKTNTWERRSNSTTAGADSYANSTTEKKNLSLRESSVDPEPDDMDWQSLHSDSLSKDPRDAETEEYRRDTSHANPQLSARDTKANGTSDSEYKGSYAQVLTRQPQSQHEVPEVHGMGTKPLFPNATHSPTQLDKYGSDATTESIAAKKDKPKEDDNCSICMDKPTNPVVLPKCKHIFCKECIDTCFDKMQPKCPNCGVIYGELKGNQPGDGTMKVSKHVRSLPGYTGYSTIVIHYHFPNGLQNDKHPHPGRKYQGTSRQAYLPDSLEGRDILRLLERAFKSQMVFTVGQSSTTGRDDSVIWNCIHHKTSTHGGTQNYGFPDPTYLKRVRQELAAQGIE